MADQVPTYQKIRIWRAFKPGNWPFRHLDKDHLDRFYPEEIQTLRALYESMREKARAMGVNFEEGYSQ